MSIFERYDEEYKGITQQITTSIGNLNYATGDQSSTLNITAGLLKQADDLIKQMDMEARDAGDRELQKKTRTYKKTLQSLRSDFQTAKGKLDHESLMAGSGSKNDQDRGRLQMVNDGLSRQNDTLNNARRVIAETEDVALEVTEELGRNREKIQSARGKVMEVGGMTNQARRLVQSMSKRETQQKIMMYGLMLVMVGTVVVVVYYMTKGDGK